MQGVGLRGLEMFKGFHQGKRVGVFLKMDESSRNFLKFSFFPSQIAQHLFASLEHQANAVHCISCPTRP